MSSPDQSAPDPSVPHHRQPVDPPPVDLPPSHDPDDPAPDERASAPDAAADEWASAPDAAAETDAAAAETAAADERAAGADADGSELEWPLEAPPSRGRQALIPVAIVLAVAAFGVAVGWLWAEIAPRVPVVKADGGRYYYGVAEPEQAVAGDGWFLVLGVIVGVLLAIAAWVLLRRYRGYVMMAALGLGSILGAWVAWFVGYKIAMTEFTRVAATTPVDGRLNAPLELAMTNMNPHKWWFPGLTGVIVAQALAAVLVYTILAGFSAFEDLGTRRPVPLPPEPEPAEAGT